MASPDVPSSGYRRYRTVALHLDPRAPRRYRLGPAGQPPLEAVVVPRTARLAEAGWETGRLGLVYLVIVGFALRWYGLGIGVSLGLLAVFVGLTFLWRYAASEVPAPIVAGSDWVGKARRRGTRPVPLYELTRIDATPAHGRDGDPLPGSTTLMLQAADRRLWVDPALLRANPALWDLVHRGITASVAAGAELTDAARAALRDALREP